MTVRELVATFGLQINEPDFKKADDRIEKLKRAAQGLAALWAGSKIVQGVRRLAQETAQLGDGLNALSARSGVAVGAIQELRYVGEAAGLSIRDVDGALFRLSRRMGAAARGNTAMVKAFASAGIAIRDQSGRVRAAEDVLMDLADRMAEMGSEGERSAVGMQLMGDTGIAMAAALSGGSAEVARLREEAREFGLMQQDLADESSRLVMNQQRLRYAIQGVKNAISNALLPWLNETLEGWLAWLRANRELVQMRLEQTVKAIAVALESVGRVVSTLARVASMAYQAMGRLGQVITWVLGVASALLVVLGLQKTLALAAVAALWLLLDDFIVWLRGGESVIGEAIEAIRRLWDEFIKADYDWREHPILKVLQEAAKLAKQVGDGIKPLHQRPGYWMDPPNARGRAKPRLGDPQTPMPFDPTMPVEEGMPRQLRHTLGGENIQASLGASGATIHQTNNLSITVPPGSSLEEVQERVQEGIDGANMRALRLLPMRGVLA